jgi:para-aminobenzoate synthetase component 1
LDPIKDEESKNKLASDPKERSENIMITDLVRNDLSQTAQKGSVQVTELCGIYSFMQEMISTVTSKLEYSAVEAIKGLILWKYDRCTKNFGYENY